MRGACPELQEDEVAHSREHSLEVELPFLQVLQPEFMFVPIAFGMTDVRELMRIGEGIAEVVGKFEEEVLIVTSTDMNHYEDAVTTRRKDQRAIECMVRLDPQGLHDVCRRERISMCGLGPAIVTLNAVKKLGVQSGELIKYATSGRNFRRVWFGGGVCGNDLSLRQACPACQKKTAQENFLSRLEKMCRVVFSEACHHRHLMGGMTSRTKNPKSGKSRHWNHLRCPMMSRSNCCRCRQRVQELVRLEDAEAERKNTQGVEVRIAGARVAAGTLALGIAGFRHGIFPRLFSVHSAGTARRRLGDSLSRWNLQSDVRSNRKRSKTCG